jgi:hypothetical protein
MKTIHIILPLAFALQAFAAEPANPSIRYDQFSEITVKLAPVRENHRISEAEFIRMAAEPGTLILDARSKNRYDRIHIKGAIHLALTDFTAEELAKIIPDKTTRILIYCNNNFENEPVNFASKLAVVSLNIQTYVNLHAYGYENVYELGPKLDIHTTRLPFAGTDVSDDGKPIMAEKPNPGLPREN